MMVQQVHHKKEFNIIINGVGGQGLITLLRIIAEAALGEGFEVRTSELHGLSQRGGSVEVHIRFDKKVFSPLIPQGKANLILSLESQEALNGAYYASKNTTFLINKYQTPTLFRPADGSRTFSKDFSEKRVLENLKNVSQKIFFISASEICQKELGTDVVAGTYLLGYATFKKFLPLKPNSLMSAIQKIIPEKYLDLNIKAFNLVKKYGK